ncbi:ABC transporter permease [Gulosibacter macacae]|uniref:ABC transporter permease n=1 Tax=Gulosibacter macacae TaxID=2488791 RepID=A0A3P3W2T5_9MICO|nr:ABC transporter permease [Gulosibacter macacae]RRJ87949.1 ABC transporter permease [Gulosibacter macacae]
MTSGSVTTTQKPADTAPAANRKRRGFGALLALPTAAWIILFSLLPVGLVFYYSFGRKPSVFGTHSNDVFTFDRYVEGLTGSNASVLWNSIGIALLGTLFCLIIALPFAYWLALKAKPSRRGLYLALVMVPFWTNLLVRTIGWQIILAPEGWLSQALQNSGLLQSPLAMLNTREAVLLGVVYNYLPMMILPLFVAFDRVAGPLREASADLGASRIGTFLRVTLPLAWPGILIAILFVFIPLMGDYITPTVLGGAQGMMIGQLVASQFQNAQNWALGSAMAVLLVITVLAIGAIIWLITKLIALPFKRHWSLTLKEDA